MWGINNIFIEFVCDYRCSRLTKIFNKYSTFKPPVFSQCSSWYSAYVKFLLLQRLGSWYFMNLDTMKYAKNGLFPVFLMIIAWWSLMEKMSFHFRYERNQQHKTSAKTLFNIISDNLYLLIEFLNRKLKILFQKTSNPSYCQWKADCFRILSWW